MNRLLASLIAWGAVAAAAMQMPGLLADEPSGAAQPGAEPTGKPAAKSSAKELSVEQQAAVAAMEKLGGKVTYDKQNQVSGIDLRNQKIRPEQLAPLAQFPNLKTLVLWGGRVTDDSLKHVSG